MGIGKNYGYIFILLISLFVFSGCGGGGDNKSSNAEESSNSSPSSLTSEEDSSIVEKKSLGALIPTEDMLSEVPVAMPPVSSYTSNELPSSFDLSNQMPPVRSQGSQGSCASWAVGYYLKGYHEHIDKNSEYGEDSDYSGAYSPAFLYNLLKLDDSCSGGTYIFANLNRVKNIGIPSWKDMPYDEKKCDVEPSTTVTSNAKCARILDYQRIRIHKPIENIEMQDMKYYLSHNNPLVIGMYVFDGFNNPQRVDGEFFYKDYNEDGYRGGHAIVVVGYDDSKNAFKIINSWGENWGNDGFLWIDYDVFSRIVFEVYRTTDVLNECEEGSSYISIDKQLLAFNRKLIGSSYKEVFTISNSGTEILNITGITVPNGYSVDWTSGTILVGESQNVTLTFTPTEEKVYSGTVFITSDANKGKNTISLSGEGINKTNTNFPPVAKAGEDITVKIGDSVRFDASQSSDDGEIISYEWKMGDSTLSNNKNFEKSDFSTGVHRITLKVTDDKGLSDTDTIVVTINENDNLKPIADAGNDVSIKFGEIVTLDASKSKDNDGKIVAYEWKEGSTVLSNKSNFSKKDFLVGKHTITLTVADNDGATDKDIVTVTVVNENKIFNTVVTATGRTWMDRNLGAIRVALSKDDHKAYGNLYQWGRKSDGHELISWKSGEEGEAINGTTIDILDNPNNSLFIINSDSWRKTIDYDLWNGINAKNNICPIGFRVPTSEELQAEMNTWTSKDSDGAFNSPLKLVLAGHRSYRTGNIINEGIEGSYWSSVSVDYGTVENPLQASALLSLTFSHDSNNIGYATTASTHLISRGYSVRCIKERTNLLENIKPFAKIYTQPTSDIVSDFATVASNDTIKFSGVGSKDSDGNIVAYEWKEGNTILSQNIEFEKNDFLEGEHKIYLTVTDNKGATDTTFLIITVGNIANKSPIANILKEEITVSCNEEFQVDASASYDPDGEMLEYSWSFFNSTTRTFTGFSFFPKKAIQTFTMHEQVCKNGDVFIFTLSVKDEDGARDSDSIIVKVRE